MPSVDVAMARSLQGSVWDVVTRTVARSITAELVRRDAISDAHNQVNDIKNTFSSWGNCMQKDYCKWPAIAIIAIGGLIIFSILTCIIRCCCLGMSCCCSCFNCLKCCGDCCGCCDPPGGRAHKYIDEPYNPPPQAAQGYNQQAPMNAHFPTVVPPPTSYGNTVPPQYAEFETKRVSPDALPAMPSWEDANSKHVMLDEAVELEDLKKAPSPVQAQSPMNAPLSGGMGGMNRNDSYRQQQNNSPAYMNAYGQQRGAPYGNRDQGPNHVSDGYGLDQPYDAPPARMGSTGPGGRQSPATSPNGYGPRQLTQGQSPYDSNAHERYNMNGPQTPYGMDPRMRNSPGPGQNSRRAPGPQGGDYGNQPRYGTPGPPGPNRMRTPGPQNDYGSPLPRNGTPGSQPRSPGSQNGYGNGPARYELPDSAQSARNSPAPQADLRGPGNLGSPRPIPYRSYTPAPASPQTPAHTESSAHDAAQGPITNNAGFDFTSGYSRPQAEEAHDYDHSASKADEDEAQEAYPGYKPYTPAQKA